MLQSAFCSIGGGNAIFAYLAILTYLWWSALLSFIRCWGFAVRRTGYEVCGSVCMLICAYLCNFGVYQAYETCNVCMCMLLGRSHSSSTCSGSDYIYVM